MPHVGVLALQGAFAKHCALLHTLGATTQLVRTAQDLDSCEALVLPGGESTTMLRHLEASPLLSALQEFAKTHPLFGTCAGMILMSSRVIERQQECFALIDIAVERNAYGRQAHSFSSQLDFLPTQAKIPALFIRAPRIMHCGKEVEVLATHEGSPVLVQQGHHMAASFHPELSDDLTVHQYFLKAING